HGPLVRTGLVPPAAPGQLPVTSVEHGDGQAGEQVIDRLAVQAADLIHREVDRLRDGVEGLAQFLRGAFVDARGADLLLAPEAGLKLVKELHVRDAQAPPGVLRADQLVVVRAAELELADEVRSLRRFQETAQDVLDHVPELDIRDAVGHVLTDRVQPLTHLLSECVKRDTAHAHFPSLAHSLSASSSADTAVSSTLASSSGPL